KLLVISPSGRIVFVSLHHPFSIPPDYLVIYLIVLFKISGTRHSMKSKKVALILMSIFIVALVAGTFLFLFLNKDQNEVSKGAAYTLPTASVFKVSPFPMNGDGIYTTETSGEWDFASHKEEGWIKVHNRASTTKKIGWQIDCRPDQPGGSDCWDNPANPKGEITVAPGEAWEVLVGRLCLPYQLDFTGPDFGRFIPPDTSKCNKTSTPRPTPTRSASPSRTPNASPTSSSTASRSPSATPTRSPSATPSRSPSATPTGTPPIGGPSNTPTPTPSPTPNPSSTATPPPSSTGTPGPSSTSTPVVAQTTSTPQPDNRAVADVSTQTETLPAAGVNNGTMFMIIGAASLLVSGAFTLLKKKYY
ncbi:MAG: LPXTG cell wall anchor domain-containing protein, partial [bacterium]|nr:LPXTG cell wall anchor domain-containing protein [bacterium]